VSYPDSLLERLDVALGAARRVADLGDGSGALAKALVARSPPLRTRLYCVELLGGGGGGQEDPITAIPMGSGSVDVVVAAQASHWFAHRAVMDEVWRVLRPGGTLALVWNTLDCEVDWVRRFQRIVQAASPPRRGQAAAAATHASPEEWLKALRHPGFSATESWTSATVRRGGREMLRKHVASPRQKRAVDALLAGHPDLACSRGEYALPHRVVLHTCRKRTFSG